MHVVAKSNRHQWVKTVASLILVYSLFYFDTVHGYRLLVGKL